MLFLFSGAGVQAAIGSGGLTLSGVSPAGVGAAPSGGLTASGSAPGRPGCIGTGGLTASGTSSVVAGLVGTGGLTAAGVAVVGAGLVGTGGMTASGSASISGITVASASGSLTASGVSAVGVGAIGTAGLTASGAAAVGRGSTGTGGLTISGSAPLGGAAGASGGLTASGAAIVGVGALGTGGLVLSGTAAGSAGPATSRPLPAWLLLMGGGSAAVIPPIVGDDHDIIEDVIARLIATGAFDDEAVVGYEQAGPASAGWAVMARVTPGEITHDDDVDPIELVARGTYSVIVTARDEDPRVRNRMLSRACNAAMNALNGVSLADVTLPGWTKVRPKGAVVIAAPDATATLGGTWAQIIEGFGGFNESGAD